MAATHNERILARLIAKAWLDKAFMTKLKKDPMAVLKQAGVKVTAKSVKVVEDTHETMHLVIPARPKHLDAHVKKHKSHPGLCSDNPDLCSFTPELCSTGPDQCLASPAPGDGEKSGAGVPHPELCSFR